MLCGEVVVVSSGIHTIHTSKWCGQNAAILNVKLCGAQVTTRRQEAEKF